MMRDHFTLPQKLGGFRPCELHQEADIEQANSRQCDGAPSHRYCGTRWEHRWSKQHKREAHNSQRKYQQDKATRLKSDRTGKGPHLYECPGGRNCWSVYLSWVSDCVSGGVEPDVGRRFAQESRAFRALHKVVFGRRTWGWRESTQYTKTVSSWSCYTGAWVLEPYQEQKAQLIPMLGEHDPQKIWGTWR